MGNQKLINVIGGAGFIGTRLCKCLIDSGHQVRIIDKAVSKYYPDKVSIADVRSTESLRKTINAGAKIINLAAEHRDDVHPKSLYHDVNVFGAENVCTVARERGVKTIVFTSSVAVYGFAPAGTDEEGRIAPFNEYGRTKAEAEKVYRAWQAEVPQERTLVIVRPTVVFGEQNRGNVYNLLKQIASGRFMMVGNGKNRKSMAYVENVAAFLEYSLASKPGVHIYNYIDRPDMNMDELVGLVHESLGNMKGSSIRVPFWLGYAGGFLFDLASAMSGRSFAVSAIRVKKFCATTSFSSTAMQQSGFKPPVSLSEGLQRTIQYEFIEDNRGAHTFHSE